MKKAYLISLLCMVFMLPLQADDFDLANSEFSEGNYDSAIQKYEQILSSGYESSALYYNLGNAYFRKGNLASAILNYERALRLNPDDKDIAHNLEYAQAMTVDKIDSTGEIIFAKWWKACRNIASSDTWAYSAVGLFVFCLIMLSVYIFCKPLWLRKTGFSLSVIALVFTALSITFSYQQKQVATSVSEAIVFAPTATVKSSPDNSGTDLFLLHEGTKIKVGSRVGEWVEITMQDGNTGWLPVSAIEII